MMKKWFLIFAGLLLAVSVLIFYSQGQGKETTTASSSRVSASSESSSKKPAKGPGSARNSKREELAPSESETASSQSSSSAVGQSDQETAAEKPAESAASSLDMPAIASGDFSSMVGTWQNARGDSYTFDAAGIASDHINLEAYTTELDANGIYRAGIRWNHGTGAAFLILPAGTSLPSAETYDGTDPTDSSQDRFIIAQSVSEHPDVYYRVK